MSEVCQTKKPWVIHSFIHCLPSSLRLLHPFRKWIRRHHGWLPNYYPPSDPFFNLRRMRWNLAPNYDEFFSPSHAGLGKGPTRIRKGPCFALCGPLFWQKLLSEIHRVFYFSEILLWHPTIVTSEKNGGHKFHKNTR